MSFSSSYGKTCQNTHAIGVWGKTGSVSATVIQPEYVLEQNDPTEPGASGVQHRLEGIFDRIVQLDVGLDLFGNMTP